MKKQAERQGQSSKSGLAMKISLRRTFAYFRDRKVSLWSKLLAVFAVVYVISPIDLIPDVIPVIGWLDDIGVVSLVVAFYLREINAYNPTTENPPSLPQS